MIRTWTKRGKRLGAGAAVVSLLGVMGGTNALAIGVGEPDPEPLAVANIKPDAKGSITIFKHLEQTGETRFEGDPTNQETSPIPNPVAGVEFTAFPFKDLPLAAKKGSEDSPAVSSAQANANWKKLSKANVASACSTVTDTAGPTLDGFTFGERQKFAATGEDGKTSLTGLPVGAYLICETKAPANIVSKAAPILVTIPYPDNARGDKSTNKWIYDVTVFPKNTETSVNKTIEKQEQYGLGIGSEVRFPVTVDIPPRKGGETYDYLIIQDPLDDRFAPGTLGVVDGSVNIVSEGKVVRSLEKGTDKDYTVTVNGMTVTVAFTKEGLAALDAPKRTAPKVQVIFTGKLASIDDGTIPNQANVWMKASPSVVENPPTTPPKGVDPLVTNVVKQRWGDIQLFKHAQTKDAEGKFDALGGAKFQVYPAADPYPENGKCAAKIATDPEDPQKELDPITVDDNDTFVSDDKGIVDIQSLFVSDSVNKPKDKDFRCYVVKEIAAPSGYVANNKAIPVMVTRGAVTDVKAQVNVENAKQGIPGLPLTGAQAQVIMQVAGVLLVLGGLAWFIARRKRENAA